MRKIITFFSLFFSISAWGQKMEIYLDYASLPSLNMILNLVENKNNKKIERIIGFERFDFNKEILNSFPKERIEFSKVSILDIKEFSDKLYLSIEKSDTPVDLIIHTNLDHSVRSLLSIFKTLYPLSHKINIEKLYLYDDGSGNYVDLYQHRQENISAILIEAQKKLKDALENRETDADKLHSLTRYTWHKIFPTEYILLRPDYLDIDEKMQPLKHFLSDTIVSMDLSRFSHFSKKQKELFLKITHFDQNIFNELNIGTKNKEYKTFIFTGTTTWEKDKEKRLNNAKLQTEILESFIKPNGKFYLGNDIKIFFKGHPKGDDINDYIISKTGAEKIPANIPFEILMMTNSLPDYVGGIMSTVYFSLPSKNIDKVIFLGSEKIKNENDAKSQTLSKLMLMLNVITPEQIAFEEMPNPINF